MPKVYLTIDDSPSPKFRELVDFLSERDIQAVFFCRGDLLESDPEAGVYAIHKGHILGNHGYVHKRASRLSYEDVCNSIRRADTVLEDVYKRAGVQIPGKYFRFPYMDRGMGSCFCEPGDLPAEHRGPQEALLREGLGHVPKEPAESLIRKKRALQDFLRGLGYEPLPVRNVRIPWYEATEMGRSVDSLCTFSTSDWAITARHKGRHGVHDADDLKDKIDQDPWLNDDSTAHIVLAHDQEDIHEHVLTLIAHMLDRGFEFETIETESQRLRPATADGPM